ncbi:MAG: DUF3108 domain-containing protein [Prosthecobacter sp.]
MRLIFGFLILLSSLSSYAQVTGLAAWAGSVTKGPLGAFPPLAPCRIVYDLSWNNLVSAGTAKIRFQELDGRWVARAEAGTNGLARALWRYDCNMASVLDSAVLRSLYMEHSETDSAETVSYRVQFRVSDVLTEATVSPKDGTPVLKYSCCPYAPVDDLQSAILYLRSQPLAVGDAITRVIQPFDRPYLATFTVMARESRKVDGKAYPTIRLDVKIRRLDTTKLELASYKKMKTATIWVSDDAWRLPVEMHASIWVGFISATLTKREWLTGPDAKATLPPSMVVKVKEK